MYLALNVNDLNGWIWLFRMDQHIVIWEITPSCTILLSKGMNEWYHFDISLFGKSSIHILKVNNKSKSWTFTGWIEQSNFWYQRKFISDLSDQTQLSTLIMWFVFHSLLLCFREDTSRSYFPQRHQDIVLNVRISSAILSLREFWILLYTRFAPLPPPDVLPSEAFALRKSFSLSVWLTSQFCELQSHSQCNSFHITFLPSRLPSWTGRLRQDKHHQMTGTADIFADRRSDHWCFTFRECRSSCENAYVSICEHIRRRWSISQQELSFASAFTGSGLTAIHVLGSVQMLSDSAFRILFTCIFDTWMWIETVWSDGETWVRLPRLRPIEWSLALSASTADDERQCNQEAINWQNHIDSHQTHSLSDD
jgi:hypothetical protein